MLRTGTADLPLHAHRCPRWLFERMARLGAAAVEAIVEEYGPQEVLERLSDPFWFQALGCVLGFDWHSSGLTTVMCAALKEGLKPRQHYLGICLAGGKGAAARKTPAEIEACAERASISADTKALVYASRMAAKVDSAAVQDGYQIYHHVFIFTASGRWAVVQQGMNGDSGWARRYHWLDGRPGGFVCEPHTAVCGRQQDCALNMVAAESSAAREASLYLAGRPAEVVKTLQKMAGLPPERLRSLNLPAGHAVPDARRIEKILARLSEIQPSSYESLLGTEGVGPSTVRALALVAEIVYNIPASRRDPVRYSFAHGGKDGHPYPVNRRDYDRSIEVLENALRRAKTGDRENLKALQRLAAISSRLGQG